MIQTIIFDWAGTTVDYGCFAPMQACRQAFADYRIPVTAAEIRQPMGLLKRDHIHAMLRMERIAMLWEQLYGRPAAEEEAEAIYAQFESGLLSILQGFTTPSPSLWRRCASSGRWG